MVGLKSCVSSCGSPIAPASPPGWAECMSRSGSMCSPAASWDGRQPIHPDRLGFLCFGAHSARSSGRQRADSPQRQWRSISVHSIQRAAQGHRRGGAAGTTGDFCDNATAESSIGLFKTELIHPRGPWRSLSAAEYGKFEWTDGSNRGLTPYVSTVLEFLPTGADLTEVIRVPLVPSRRSHIQSRPDYQRR